MGTGGKSAFYEGPIADSIVASVAAFGGVMVSDDLRNHLSTFDIPVNTDYKGVRIWECPPNGQGVVTLMTLNILEPYDLKCKNGATNGPLFSRVLVHCHEPCLT